MSWAQGAGKSVVGGLSDERLCGLFGAAIDQRVKGSPTTNGGTEYRGHDTAGSCQQEISGRGASSHLRV